MERSRASARDNAAAPGSAILRRMAYLGTRSLGMLLLGIYLILVGLSALVTLPIPALVMGVLALIAGVLILLGR